MRLGLLISAMMGLAVNWMVPATASTSTSPSAIIRGNVAPAYYYHGGYYPYHYHGGYYRRRAYYHGRWRYY
jgi:hypothetical protein